MADLIKSFKNLFNLPASGGPLKGLNEVQLAALVGGKAGVFHARDKDLDGEANMIVKMNPKEGSVGADITISLRHKGINHEYKSRLVAVKSKGNAYELKELELDGQKLDVRNQGHMYLGLKWFSGYSEKLRRGAFPGPQGIDAEKFKKLLEFYGHPDWKPGARPQGISEAPKPKIMTDKKLT